MSFRTLLGGLLLGSMAACTPAALPMAAGHPARPDAPAGRRAEASPTLRPGVAGDVLAEPARADRP